MQDTFETAPEFEPDSEDEDDLADPMDWERRNIRQTSFKFESIPGFDIPRVTRKPITGDKSIVTLKPWVRSAISPSNAPIERRDIPQAKVQLSFVFGIRAQVV